MYALYYHLKMFCLYQNLSLQHTLVLVYLLVLYLCQYKHVQLMSFLQRRRYLGDLFNPYLTLFILIFIHLKLCLATATHNFKWLKITHIYLIRAQLYKNVDA